MAISNYLQSCEYKIGGLKSLIYVINKNALKLNIKANGIDVSFNNTNESDIYKIEAQMVTYEQQETYANKFRFNSSVKVLINEQYREPFFYGLRTLRTNQYYIIVEDKKGVQYLFNPELYTKMTYEYTFSDNIENNNSVEITWNNLSNFPLLIFKKRIESNNILLGDESSYNIGNVYSLVMTRFKDLKTKDDGVKAKEIYVDNIENLNDVEYIKESFTLIETYDGNKFTTELTFSIPLSDHKFEWAYDLLEFDDNTYKGLVRTTNDNYLLLGNENGLFPSYTIKTSEDDETLNVIEFKFTNISQYPILYTDNIKQYKWIPDGELCFGFDNYNMLKQQYSNDLGKTWIDTYPILRKKGDAIARNTDECKEYRWVDDYLFCSVKYITYVKWIEVEGQFICEDGNKYAKLKKYESSDGITYTSKEEYAKGRLIGSNSTDCNYVSVRWVDVGIGCYEVDESKTYTVDTGDTYCKGTSLCTKYVEFVTYNGKDYFEYDTGAERVIEEKCCECGYRELIYRFNNEYICGSDLNEQNATRLTINSYQGYWTVYNNTFTSDEIGNSQTTVQRIYFQLSKPGELKFDIVQSSELNFDYLIISNLDSSAQNNTVSGNNFCNWKGKTSGTTAMTIPDSNEHFIELMYRKDASNSIGSDNVQVTLRVENELLYDNNMKYEVWREFEICSNQETGNIEYRNPIESNECI